MNSIERGFYIHVRVSYIVYLLWATSAEQCSSNILLYNKFCVKIMRKYFNRLAAEC